jgi:hypothetical protein
LSQVSSSAAAAAAAAFPFGREKTKLILSYVRLFGFLTFSVFVVVRECCSPLFTFLLLLLFQTTAAAPLGVPRDRRGRRRRRRGPQRGPDADLRPAVVAQVHPGPCHDHGRAGQGRDLEPEEGLGEGRRRREPAAEQEVGEQTKDDRLFFYYYYFFFLVIFHFYFLALSP